MPAPPRPNPAKSALALLMAVFMAGCVFRIDVQQGNLLDAEDIDQVEIGMTRSQVQFLLGTPMISDSFHRDRWDYAYFLRRGRERDAEQRWVVIQFDGDRVRSIDRDLELQPAPP